jgi:RNA polymerase sigma factor (sigma-70 family)
VDAVEGFDHIIREEDKEALITVHQLLDRLSGDLREVAIYHFIDGFGLKEIAEMTGDSEKTIGRRLGKIEKKMSAFLKLDRNI